MGREEEESFHCRPAVRLSAFRGRESVLKMINDNCRRITGGGCMEIKQASLRPNSTPVSALTGHSLPFVMDRQDFSAQKLSMLGF